MAGGISRRPRRKAWIIVPTFLLAMTAIFRAPTAASVMPYPLEKPYVWLYSLVAADRGGHLLLPHHIEHYLKLGILREHFFVDLLHDPEEPTTGFDACHRFLLGHAIAFRVRNESYTPAGQDVNMMTALAGLEIAPDDWVVIADGDELYSYGADTVYEAIALMEAEGATYAQGEMLDHVSANGTLPEVRTYTNLWDQFPLVCPVTAKIAEGLPAKITLHKGFLRVGAGHHHIVKPNLAKAYFSGNCHGLSCEEVMKLYKQRSTVDLFNLTPYHRYRFTFQHQQLHPRVLVQWKAQAWSRWTKVHHFKWHSALIDDLNSRIVRDSGDCRLGMNEDNCTPAFQFWKEVAREHAALSKVGVLNISDLGCKTFREGVDTFWNWPDS